MELCGARHNAARSSQNASNFAASAGASFQEMNKRFKATRDGTNMVTILTQIKNANAESGVGIKMVDKRNGKEVANLILDNKKPEYVLDDIGRMVYYTATHSKLYAYQL